MFHFPYPGDNAPEHELRAWADKEVEIIAHQLTMLAAGLAVRHEGLIWFLPLCHDAYGEGNA